RLLGAYDAASWSPHGLFVAASRGQELFALDPGGHVHWSIARPRPVLGAGWASDGVRIAYRSGGALRLVAGDGTGDRLLLRSVAPAAAAWRPGKGHVLAVSDWAGRVLMLDADSGGLLWRSTEATIPTELSWSADGRRLLALSPRSVRLFDAGGRSLTTISTPVGARAEAAAFVPGRHEFALLQHERPADRSHVDLVRADSGRRPSQRLFA